jgi:superfamily I DNA/RNA helicase
MLRGAGEGLLTGDEQKLLLRGAAHPLTDSDAALVDEASVVLGAVRRAERRRDPEVDEEEQWMIERMLDDLQETEPIIRMARGVFAERYAEQRRSLERRPAETPAIRDRFGYVIVDEAQGLSPMQWRMIARRCPSGRMTVLGDLGQAGVSAPQSWDEALVHAGVPSVDVAELTINYRTPAEIMDVAARVLEASGAGVTPPRSVRSTGAEPVVRIVDERDVAGAAVDAAQSESTGLADAKVAIVTAEELVEPIAAELHLDLVHLDAAGLLDAPITVLAIEDARGLEFDTVVVAEPQAIVDATAGGLRALYVAMTRPTQTLTVVASRLDDTLSAVLRRSS